jgi:hypothetical protein
MFQEKIGQSSRQLKVVLALILEMTYNLGVTAFSPMSQARC